MSRPSSRNPANRSRQVLGETLKDLRLWARRIKLRRTRRTVMKSLRGDVRNLNYWLHQFMKDGDQENLDCAIDECDCIITRVNKLRHKLTQHDRAPEDVSLAEGILEQLAKLDPVVANESDVDQKCKVKRGRKQQRGDV